MRRVTRSQIDPLQKPRLAFQRNLKQTVVQGIARIAAPPYPPARIAATGLEGDQPLGGQIAQATAGG